MAKGRKRKAGRRTVSGKLSEARSEREKRGLGDVRAVVMNQPHRAGFGKDRRLDQRAATEVGRLFMAGRISEAEYWAAERWARLVGEFHQVLASPVTTSTMLGRLVADGYQDAREGDVGAAERPETDDERRERVLVQHDAAMRVLRRLDDAQAVFRVMEAVVLHDRCAEDARARLALRAGLSQLARLWRLAAPKEGESRVRFYRSDRPTWPHEVRIVDIVLK